MIYKGKLLEKAVINVAQEAYRKMVTTSWLIYDENLLWRELVACNLGSRISFEQAKATVYHLEKAELLKLPNRNIDFKQYVNRLLENLIRPIIFSTPSGVKQRKYPFPALKANHIARTAINIYGSGTSLSAILASSSTVKEARNVLLQRCIGIGPKQASLFLKNVGFTQDVAVLDKHVLRYMFFIGLLPTLISSVPHLHRYECLEEKLRRYSERLSIEMMVLDIAIWVVMRVYQREFA